MTWAAPSSARGGATFRAAARTASGAPGHGHAHPDLGDHLQVVELVADRQDVAQVDAETAGQPAHGSALVDARRQELEERRVAHRDVGAPGELGPGRARIASGTGGGATARILVTGPRIQRVEVGHDLRPARSSSAGTRPPAGRRPA